MKNIILIRHGESEANIDFNKYNEIGDHLIKLTNVGKNQAYQTGKKLKKQIKDENLCFFVSPYLRTEQTYKEIKKQFNPEQFITRYDPRIIEQQWNSRCDVIGNIQNIKKAITFGEFYYRPNSGESCLDIYGGRLSAFLHDLETYLKSPDCPNNIVIITHSIFIKILITRLFWLNVADFSKLPIPQNCSLHTIKVTGDSEYEIKDEIYHLKSEKF